MYCARSPGQYIYIIVREEIVYSVKRKKHPAGKHIRCHRHIIAVARRNNLQPDFRTLVIHILLAYRIADIVIRAVTRRILCHKDIVTLESVTDQIFHIFRIYNLRRQRLRVMLHLLGGNDIAVEIHNPECHLSLHGRTAVIDYRHRKRVSRHKR